MKNLILCTAIIFGIFACGKKKTTTPKEPQGSSTKLKMKVNGVPIELSYTAIWTYDSGAGGKYGFAVTENKTGTEAPERKLMSIGIQESDLVLGSTHDVGVGNNNTFIYFANHSSINGRYKAASNFPASHGTFTVTKIKEGTGGLKYFYCTFSGTVVNLAGDSIIITDGQIIE